MSTGETTPQRPDRKPRVYLSSTADDLGEHRKEVRSALSRIGFDVVCMENYAAEETRPVEKCCADVESCDLYIGVFAWRYGHVPDGHERSVTEQEYRAAGEAGLHRLVFLLDEDAPWPVSRTDRDRGRIDALRAELSERHTRDHFEDVGTLRSKVAEAASRWLQGEWHPSASSAALAMTAWSAYHQRLRRQFERLDLDALTPPQREEYLQIYLREVFVEPDVRERASRPELSKELWRKLEEAAQIPSSDIPTGYEYRDLQEVRRKHQERLPQPVLDVLTQTGGRLCVLLGDPGSGKSTLARYLVLSLIGESPEDTRLAPLAEHQPLLVELRDYYYWLESQDGGGRGSFTDYLAYRHDSDGFGLPEQLLHSYLREDGRAYVVFDGLDEIFESRDRETVGRRIADFAATYPDARVLVTSRSIGYRRHILDNAGFTHFMLEDLDWRKVEKFLGAWYELALHDKPGQAGQLKDRLSGAIKDAPAILELAGNPLLLTILAIIGKHQELPRERAKVYDHAASVLVQHWDVNKHLNDVRIPADVIREDDKKELLRQLGYRMQRGERGLAGNHIMVDDLRREIVAFLRHRFQYSTERAHDIAAATIDQFHTRNFILAQYGGNVYGFVHRALLEYFCAWEIVVRFEKSRDLTEEGLYQVFVENWRDPSWTEVLRMVSGMLDAGVVDKLLSRFVGDHAPGRTSVEPAGLAAVTLAVQCLAEVRRLGACQAATRVTTDALIELLRFPYRNVVDRRDQRLDDDILPALTSIGATWPQRLTYWNWFRRHGRSLPGGPAARFGARIAAALFPDSQEVRDFLHAELHYNGVPEQRRASLRGVVSVWGAERGPQTALDALRRDPDDVVRIASVDALAEHFADDDEARAAVFFALGDFDWEVRQSAVSALAARWTEHPDSFPAIIRRIRDMDDMVRREAVKALAKHYAERADAQTAVLGATLDPDYDVRREAIDALATRWTQAPGSLTAVNRALADPRDSVREAAVELLAGRWRDDPETLKAVRGTLRDISANVRTAAVNALVAHWPDRDETADAVRAAAADPTGEVRLTAIRARARLAQDPDAERGTMLDALGDYDPQLRQEALAALLREAVDEPRLPGAIRTLARDPNSDVRAAAIEALAEHWPDHQETRARLLLSVRDPNPQARLNALDGLVSGQAEPDRIAAILDAATHDNAPRVRRFALSALAVHRPQEPAAAASLDRALHDPDWDNRTHAVHLRAARSPLTGDGPTDVIGSATDSMFRPRNAARLALATGRLDSWPDLEAMRAGMSATDRGTRLTALEALVRTAPAPEGVRQAIDQGLADPDREVREAALRSLVVRRDIYSDTLQVTAAIAESQDHWLRAVGLRVLLSTWPEKDEAVRACRRGLTDSDSSVRGVAVEAVLAGASLAVDAHAIALDHVTHPSPFILRLAAETLLVRSGDSPDTLSRFLEGLRHPDHDVRRYALMGLVVCRRDAPETADAIRRCLRDSDTDVFRSALDTALFVAASELRAEALDRAAADPDYDVRITTRWALAGKRLAEVPTDAGTALRATRSTDPFRVAVGLWALVSRWPDDERSRGATLRLVQHWDSGIQDAAISSLVANWHDHPETLAALFDACGDPRVSVRFNALQAIIWSRPDLPGALPALVNAAYDPVLVTTGDAAGLASMLACVAPGSAEVRRVLIDVLLPSARGSGHAAVLETLQTSWPHHPDTAAVLRRSASEYYWNSVATGIDGLSHLQPSAPERHQAIERAQRHPVAMIRRRARYSGHGSDRLADSASAEWTERADAIRSRYHVDAIADLRAAARDAHPRVRVEAMEALLAVGPRDGGAWQTVQAAVEDESPLVRAAGLQALAVYWPALPETRAHVLDAVEDPDADVGVHALGLLADCWPDDAHTRQAALAAVRDPEYPTPMDEVLRIFIGTPDEGEALESALVCGKTSFATVADEVGNLRRAPVSRAFDALVEQTAAADPVERRAARSALVSAWPDVPHLQPHLRRWLRECDDHERVPVLIALAAHHAVDETGIRELAELAESDRCAGVRSWALHVTMARTGADFPLSLFHHAAAEEIAETRQMAFAWYAAARPEGVVRHSLTSRMTADSFIDRLAAIVSLRADPDQPHLHRAFAHHHSRGGDPQQTTDWWAWRFPEMSHNPELLSGGSGPQTDTAHPAAARSGDRPPAT